jgi:hypothetical protein
MQTIEHVVAQSITDEHAVIPVGFNCIDAILNALNANFGIVVIALTEKFHFYLVSRSGRAVADFAKSYFTGDEF